MRAMTGKNSPSINRKKYGDDKNTLPHGSPEEHLARLEIEFSFHSLAGKSLMSGFINKLIPSKGM